MPSKRKILVYPIGYIKTKVDKNRIKSDKIGISTIILKKEFAEALEGIEDFSHLFVIFYMHQIVWKGDLKIHPRGKNHLPLIGLFASRSAHRPNPIGLTLVKLLKRKKNTLNVMGLDAFNGSPVIDIKPLNSLDQVNDFTVPDWVKTLELEK